MLGAAVTAANKAVVVSDFMEFISSIRKSYDPINHVSAHSFIPILWRAPAEHIQGLVQDIRENFFKTVESEFNYKL